MLILIQEPLGQIHSMTFTAGLTPGITSVFNHASPYGNHDNLSVTDSLWSSIDTAKGMVALSKSPALHPTETFPWDKSKGVYMLNGYHGLHCLVSTAFKSLESSVRNTQRFYKINSFLRIEGGGTGTKSLSLNTN